LVSLKADCRKSQTYVETNCGQERDLNLVESISKSITVEGCII